MAGARARGAGLLGAKRESMASVRGSLAALAKCSVWPQSAATHALLTVVVGHLPPLPLGCGGEHELLLRRRVDTSRSGHLHVLFFLELWSRRAWIAGITRNPREASGRRFLNCDRDTKSTAWFRAMIECQEHSGHPRPVPGAALQRPAERFVRPIEQECLNKQSPFGEGHLRRAIDELVEHGHHERPHQGAGNKLVERDEIRDMARSSALSASVACCASTGERRGRLPVRAGWTDLSDTGGSMFGVTHQLPTGARRSGCG